MSIPLGTTVESNDRRGAVAAMLALAVALLAAAVAACGSPAGSPTGDGGLPTRADGGLPPATDGGSDLPARAPGVYLAPEEVDEVVFRTNTQTFNSRYYALTHGGRIFIKPNRERTGEDGPWTELSLPDGLRGDVTGIAWDDRFLMAVSSSGVLYQMSGGLSSNPADFVWREYRGLPFMTGPLNHLPADAIKWDSTVMSPEEDEYYTDRAGNRFEPGTFTVAHMMVLKAGGRWIAFNDSWLPADLHYEICGPERGRFRALNLSSSGSTHFVIGRHGDMYTRLWDFDICARNPSYTYSFEDQRGALLPARQLPCGDWRPQPRIPGAITNLISLHKLGKGCVQRTLRVEGQGPDGGTGYWEKDIAAEHSSDWTFHPLARPLWGTVLDNRPVPPGEADLAPPEDVHYARNLDRLSTLSGTVPPGGLTDDQWAGEVLDFNAYCSPSTLRVHTTASASIELVLHHVHTVRLNVRQERGLTDEPWDFAGTIEIPQQLYEARAALDPKTREILRQYFEDRRFTWWDIRATRAELTLTKGTLQWTFAR